MNKEEFLNTLRKRLSVLEDSEENMSDIAENLFMDVNL